MGARRCAARARRGAEPNAWPRARATLPLPGRGRDAPSDLQAPGGQVAARRVLARPMGSDHGGRSGGGGVRRVSVPVFDAGHDLRGDRRRRPAGGRLLRRDGAGVLGRAVRPGGVALLAPAAALPRRRGRAEPGLPRPGWAAGRRVAGRPPASGGGAAVGRLKGGERAAPVRAAGALCVVEAIDREGFLVTSEGALVRFLRAAPKNPLVMAPVEREQVGHALGQLAGRLASGQSLQFYVEAAPIRLDALLAHSEDAAERAIRALASNGHGRAAALRRLHGALRESLERHADEQAAVDVSYYVVVPYLPDQANRVAWRQLLPGGRRRLPRAPLERSLASHRRVARESLHLTDAIRGDLEALDLSTHLLSGPEVLDLLWRRFNPTTADRTPERRPGAREDRLEVVGELDVVADARDAAKAAHVLRELVAASGIDWPDQRHLRVDRDLEQALYVATLPDATEFGWLLDAMQVQRPFTLSVHVHALDRLRERSRFKARHRRLFGVNRGAEVRGRTPDYEMLAQEEELGELLKELSGHERSAAFELSIYQSIRERGPDPDPVQLAEAVEQASREIIAASDARGNLGQLRQLELWQSTLPLGRDVARLTRKYVTRH